MKLHIGSKNETKIQAVREAVLLYPNLFPGAEIEGIDVRVDLYGHPKTTKETVKGAIERAKRSYKGSNFSFGLESGLMEAPGSNSGYLEVPVCAIFDGSKTYIGFGAAFEWPEKVLGLVLKGEADASKAFKDLGLTQHEKLGAAQGGIASFLTHGRMTREEQTKQSIIMALIQVEHSELY